MEREIGNGAPAKRVVPHSKCAEAIGMREEDWPSEPEGIARHLALMDQIEPLEMTPGEESEWQAARKAQKDFELAKWDEKWRKIESEFE